MKPQPVTSVVPLNVPAGLVRIEHCYLLSVTNLIEELQVI